MTVAEFRSEFDLLYNNTLGEGAPGLDNYERSVYLTTAQEELVKSLYTGGNPSRQSFEDSEHQRRALNELVKDYKATDVVSSNRGLVEDSKMFSLPNDIMFIVAETATISSTDTCLNGKVVTVKPITHDEFMVSYKNPFRKPNTNKVFRVDISKENSSNTVELVSSENLSQYNIRYVKYPNPIILSDLTTDTQVGGLGLTINGETNVAGSELNSYLHREIVNRAVELAVRDYRENTLQTRIQTNNRV
jgi:hypothetical protein